MPSEVEATHRVTLSQTIASVVEELRRNPLRPALAAAGMMVGIMALACIGSLAWQLCELAQEAGRTNMEVLAAVDRDALASRKADEFLGDLLLEVRKTPGIRSASTMLMLPYRLDVDFTRLLPPQTVIAFVPDMMKLDRALRDDEAVLGVDFAAIEGLRRGDDLAIYGNLFHVVQVLPRRYSYVDQSATISQTAGRLLLPQLTDHRATTALNARRPFTVIRIAVGDTADLDSVVRALNAIPHLSAQDPRQYARLISSALALVLFIVFGTMVMTLLTAVAAIGNTMSSAVSARRTEIGIRRAIGATRRAIFVEIGLEAIAQGAAGGVLGVSLAFVVDPVLQPLERLVGSADLFRIHPVVAAMSIVISILSATIAGVVPAIQASQVEPASAIRG